MRGNNYCNTRSTIHTTYYRKLNTKWFVHVHVCSKTTNRFHLQGRAQLTSAKNVSGTSACNSVKNAHVSA